MPEKLQALATALDEKAAVIAKDIERRVNAAPLHDTNAIHLVAHDGIKAQVYKDIAETIRAVLATE